MKNFKEISPSKNRLYKIQNESVECAHCGTEINKEKDHFQLSLFWTIKKKADIKNFCSLDCVREWCRD
jgi:hypothetical protein